METNGFMGYLCAASQLHGVRSHGGTPSYHPFVDGFSIKPSSWETSINSSIEES